jgi:hypothetical protein
MPKMTKMIPQSLIRKGLLMKKTMKMIWYPQRNKRPKRRLVLKLAKRLRPRRVNDGSL